MTPCAASVSVTAPKVAPGGKVTRSGVVLLPAQAQRARRLGPSVSLSGAKHRLSDASEPRGSRACAPGSLAPLKLTLATALTARSAPARAPTAAAASPRGSAA